MSHCLLNSIVSDEDLLWSLHFFLHICLPFFYCVYIFSLSSLYSNLIMICLGVVIFKLLVFEFHCASWICVFIISLNLENSFQILFCISLSQELLLHLYYTAWSCLTAHWCSIYFFIIFDYVFHFELLLLLYLQIHYFFFNV